MYEGDIVLDANGNSVIRNGALQVTGSDVEFVLRSLKYGQGSWSLHPGLGLGLDQYIGMVNNEETRDLIRNDILTYFSNNSIVVEPIVAPVGLNDISISLELPLAQIDIGLVFSLDSGVFVFDSANREDQYKKINDQVREPNKYQGRRFVSVPDSSSPTGFKKIDIT